MLDQDFVGLKEYKNKKETANKMIQLSDEINNMKSDISEIKSLLTQLVNQAGK